MLAAETVNGHSWFTWWFCVAVLTGRKLDVMYFVSVRRILSVSSRECKYEESARSTSDIGQVVCAGMLDFVCAAQCGLDCTDSVLNNSLCVFYKGEPGLIGFGAFSSRACVVNTRSRSEIRQAAFW